MNRRDAKIAEWNAVLGVLRASVVKSLPAEGR